MTHALIVGVGGFIGSILRYWLSGLAHRWVQDAFPAGTLLVNVLGCLAVGTFGASSNIANSSARRRMCSHRRNPRRLDDFSAFGYETFALLHDREYWAALANVSAAALAGIAAGYSVGWLPRHLQLKVDCIMRIEGEARLLRIFTGESDRWDGQPLLQGDGPRRPASTA